MRTRVERLLPLKPTTFEVLAALAGAPRPGIEILERVNRGMTLLGPGTLYRLLRELRQEGLIRHAAAPDDAAGAEDERRHYHELTALGQRVLRAEAVRLRGTLQRAGLLEPAAERGR